MLTSTLGTNPSFSDKLTSKIQSNAEAVNIPSTSWLQFLQDHKTYIRNRSSTVTLTETDLVKYQYRIRRYLTESYGGTYIELVFRVINNLADDVDFNLNLVGESVYVPPTSLVNELRSSYRTNLSMATKL